MYLDWLHEERKGPCFDVEDQHRDRRRLIQAWFRPPPVCVATDAELRELIDRCPEPLPPFRSAHPAREYPTRPKYSNAWGLVRSATTPFYDTAMYGDSGRFIGETSDRLRNVLAMRGQACGTHQDLYRLYRAWREQAASFEEDVVIAATGSWSREGVEPRVLIWHPRRAERPFELRKYGAPDIMTGYNVWPWRTLFLAVPRPVSV